MWSTVRLGNNVIHGDRVARTLLVVGGSRLVDAERRADALFVSADVYDDHGRRIGVLGANRWTAQSSAFVMCEADRVVVEDVRNSTVLLDVRATETQLVVSAMRWVPVTADYACSTNGAV